MRSKLERDTRENMDKLPKTATELEALVLAELHAVSGCTGARHVTVIPYTDHRVSSNWEVASFDPGTSEWSRCEPALLAIVHALQQQFDIAP
jgi:hypothetical protein